MGTNSFHTDDYTARAKVRAATGVPVFAYSSTISSGAAAAKVHDSLSPFGVKLRESRDSAEHPETVPVVMLLDTTGSMGKVPVIMQKNLVRLMSGFLEAKASGKAYLGNGYPAILISAVDDFDAMRSTDGNGTLQVGQFESGIEIDQNLEKLWLTGHGGGTYHESYEIGLYFMARHTAHDHFEKRGRKGYIFIIGDERAYGVVSKEAVKAVIGDTLEADIPFKDILAEVREKYNVFFVIPALSSYYNDANLEKWWVSQLGQQNVIKLDDPSKVCELIVGAVAISEEHAGISDLIADGLAASNVLDALVPLSKSVSNGVVKYTTDIPALTESDTRKAIRL